MRYTIPDYYREFHCIAGACPATCCAGWQIVIDEKSLKKYGAYQGPFGNRLANSIDWKEKSFRQYDGRCAFLDENNLCDIYSEAGPQYLCRTCRRYPRHVEEFANEREISLSLSCPAVAKLLLERDGRVRFLSMERAVKEEEEEDFDFFLYSILQDTRSGMFEILQNRRRPISFRLAKVLALAHDVQNRINAGKLFEAEEVLQRYQKKGADEKLEKRFEKYRRVSGQPERIRALFGLLGELEVLDESWPGQVKRCETELEKADCSMEQAGSGTDCNMEEEKADSGVDCEMEQERAIVSEQLSVYFLFTYFCGAVYDGDALSKVKMALVSTLLLQEMERILIRQHGIGKTAGEESPTEKVHAALQKQREEIAWRFSRELEHSDLNLEKMEELMRTSPAAEFETLLECILH